MKDQSVEAILTGQIQNFWLAWRNIMAPMLDGGKQLCDAVIASRFFGRIQILRIALIKGWPGAFQNIDDFLVNRDFVSAMSIVCDFKNEGEPLSQKSLLGCVTRQLISFLGLGVPLDSYYTEE